MLIHHKRTLRTRTVPAFRAKALAKTGLYEIVNTYQTRDMRAQAPAKTELPQEGQMATLRADYQSLFSKKPYMGWDAQTLRVKIDEKLAQGPSEE